MKKLRLNFQLIEVISATALILLWSLTAGDKLSHFTEFKIQLDKQVFSKEFATALLYIIPPAEITAAVLLVLTRTRLAGFIFSFLLLILFTGYIGLVLTGYYRKVPCGCVSVINGMGFTAHFFFNLFFTAVAAIGFIFKLKAERRNKGMDKQMSHAPLPA